MTRTAPRWHRREARRALIRRALARDPDVALSEHYAEAQAQIARTDAKATNLIAIISTALAGLSLVAAFLPVPLAAAVVGGLGATALMAAATPLLWVIRSRLTPAAPGTVPHWATLTPEQMRQEARTDRRAAATVTLSRIAVAKHHRIQRAVDLIYAAGALLALALLIAIATEIAAAIAA